MMVRTYGRRSRSMTRSYNTDSECDGGVSDSISQESPQDVYNFTFSSQESAHWMMSDHSYNLINSSSSQDNNQMAILPPRNGKANGGFEAFDGNFWKSSKKVKIGDSEPFALNSSQESDELEILPSEGYKETQNSGYSNGIYGNLTEPYRLNSSQESDDLAILGVKSSRDNGRVDGVHKKSKKVKDNGVLHKRKKKAKSSELGSGVTAVNPTKTLMETQEFGEMMEHVDEVNFALDGLRKGQPVRVRRASLLSLLSICGTAQQRRLLRAHGLAKTIIDAILGLSFDDTPSNLAAAALFYILTGDGQDEYLLDSPNCIHFLIKLVKPHTSDAAKAKAFTLGSKLLAIRIDADGSQDSTRGSDSSTAAIMLKVQEVLVSCKDMKPRNGNDDRVERPELNPKWISLLTMEKACLSTVSLEDSTGRVRKSRGNFKEKLRELGGLNAVFEVARNCHFALERWLEPSQSSVLEEKDNSGLESLVLLSKCMKIMENATFLSNENQKHLLGMKGSFDSERAPRTFTKLILSAIKILSDISLLQSSSSRSQEEKTCNHSSEISQASEYKVIDDEILFIASSARSSIMEGTSSQKSSSMCQCDQWLTSGLPRSSGSNCETTTTIDPWLKMRIDSSTSESCSGTSGNTNSRAFLSNRSAGKFAITNNCKSSNDNNCGLGDDSQDPFAFDEDDCEPSKWDLLSGRHKMSRPQNTRAEISEQENGHQSLMQKGQEKMGKENCRSSEVSCSSTLDEEMSNLLADCLLSAVKALMNLTNDNPVGCQQIASCGGLEILSALIASHFPMFTSYMSAIKNSRENSILSRSSVEVENQKDVHLTDAELDLLVAILGLLVNLVEKDGRNRSQLAATSVSLRNLEGLEGGIHTNLIPLLCSIFLANQGAGEATEGLSMDDEDALLLQGEKEAEKMIVEAYSALLLAFLSTESRSTRSAIAECLPDHNMAILVPVLERFVDFHLSLNMISPETHTTVLEVIESCRIR